WPVRTDHHQYPPSKVMSVADEKGNLQTGLIVNSLIASGSVIAGAEVTGSVLSLDVHVGRNAVITNSVIMESVVIGENAKIKNAIIDKQVVIPPNARIGYDAQADRQKFVMTTSGIVIVAKKEEVK
ncbi:MAG: glucose-1-phosphate adenylyltransferase, partial [Candidatus Omnitrophica bacterium]|nr:glucose-1-phosphate adenylyltransferase [Candidatus Omnitrophota bacterium]